MKPPVYLQGLEKKIRGWLPEDSASSYQRERPNPAGWKHADVFWYLLPLFLPIVGGVIGWAVNVEGDPKRARNLLVFGAIWTVVFIALMIFGLYLGFVKVIDCRPVS
jgi:hypothetical protein